MKKFLRKMDKHLGKIVLLGLFGGVVVAGLSTFEIISTAYMNWGYAIMCLSGVISIAGVLFEKNNKRAIIERVLLASLITSLAAAIIGLINLSLNIDFSEKVIRVYEIISIGFLSLFLLSSLILFIKAIKESRTV